MFNISFFLLAQAPKARRTRRKAAAGEDETDGEGEITEGGTRKVLPRRKSNRVTRSNPDGGRDETTSDEEPITPKAKPRPRAVRRQKTPTGSVAEDLVQHPSLKLTTPSRVLEAEREQFATSTPQTSRKRPRNEEPDEEMSDNSRGGSPEEPEIEVRRKRVRH